jgi:hypothetical protein
MVEERALGRAADDAAEVRPDRVDDDVQVAAERGEHGHLLRVGVEVLRQPARRRLPTRERLDGLVGRIDRGRGTELGEHPCRLVAAAPPRMLVRGAEWHVATPCLPAGTVEVGSVLREQAHELRASAAADGMRDERALVRVGARLEQEPDVLERVLVERVRKCVRPARRGAVLEEQAQAVGLGGLGRVVEGLAVVRVGAGFQEHSGQLGVVRDTGGAVERRHRPVLVLEARVRVGAALEQLPCQRRRGEAGVADVEERSPAAWPAGRAGVPAVAASEREARPGVLRDLGPRGEHRLGSGSLPGGRRKHERVRVGRSWSCCHALRSSRAPARRASPGRGASRRTAGSP